MSGSTSQASQWVSRTGCVGVLFAGAIFGFFYAWVCSAMPGLDAADPRVAIAAMQAVNEKVRNAVFFPAFFLTPIALLLPAFLAARHGARQSSVCFTLAAIVYFLGGLVLTLRVNVPMNEALGLLPVPESVDEARTLWNEYSTRWQVWNLARTVFSGLALMLAALGLSRLR